MRSSASSLRGGALRACAEHAQLRSDQILSGVLAREPGPLARACISAIRSGRPDAGYAQMAVRRSAGDLQQKPDLSKYVDARTLCPMLKGADMVPLREGRDERPDGSELPRSQWSRPCAGWRLVQDATGGRGVPGPARDVARTPRRRCGSHRLARPGGYRNASRRAVRHNLRNGCRARATADQILPTLGAATAAVLPVGHGEPACRAARLLGQLQRRGAQDDDSPGPRIGR